MQTIGLFEAKTKFSELCDNVVASGRSYIVTRRGKPIAKITPIEPAKKSKGSTILRLRREYVRKHGPWKDDFKLPPRAPANYRNPLD